MRVRSRCIDCGHVSSAMDNVSRLIRVRQDGVVKLRDYRMRANSINSHRRRSVMVDAEIRLKQGDTESYDDDVGVVPLLYLAGTYQLSNRWTIRADFDGLAGGPGRAIDLGLALDFRVSRQWQIGAEVRVLDGGADTDDVYNFARFNSSAIAISTAF